METSSPVSTNPLKSIAESVLLQMPGLLLCKDKQSRYLSCNYQYAKEAGFRHPQEAVGKFDADMRCKAAECAEAFIAQDKKVLQGEALVLLDVQIFTNNKPTVYLTHKSPLTDEQGLRVGTICHITKIENPELLQISHMLTAFDQKQLAVAKNRNDYVIDYKHADIKLTTRESECLFYILRGQSSRSIGELLNISKRTVETYTDNLKDKLACQSKAELIEKAIANGMLHFIPETLLTQRLPKLMDSL